MTPVEELALLLRPAGGGLYLVSTGRAQQRALQQQLYAGELSLPSGADDAAIERAIGDAFRARLDRLADARLVILGAPSDVGAGFRRGANLGPWGVRQALVHLRPSWPAELAGLSALDLGDVFVVPQLLHDEMLSPGQREATGKALYPTLDAATRARLPVSPLSMLERALDLILAINPAVIPILIGGDHSNALPMVAALARTRPPGSFGIVQPDAHTDLLAERLGIRVCFATWSYHANELIGRGQRLVQVGIRATRHDRGHWEGTLAVQQRWADECRARPLEVIEEIVAHLRGIGVGGVYFSNDIDATDERWASATGTPEAAGLDPDFVIALVRRLGADIGLIAGDVMEVAPPLGPTPADADRTCRLGATYLRETIYAALGQQPTP